MHKQTKTKSTPFKWIHKMVKQSRTPWTKKSPDDLRILWFFDEETKQAIYEYRNDKGGTNGFAITSLLQQQLPQDISEKYFTNKQRAIVFGFFFTEITEFVNDNVDEIDFCNFTGVTKAVFSSTDNYESYLELCEQSI